MESPLPDRIKKRLPEIDEETAKARSEHTYEFLQDHLLPTIIRNPQITIEELITMARDYKSSSKLGNDFYLLQLTEITTFKLLSSDLIDDPTVTDALSTAQSLINKTFEENWQFINI